MRTSPIPVIVVPRLMESALSRSEPLDAEADNGQRQWQTEDFAGVER